MTDHIPYKTAQDAYSQRQPRRLGLDTSVAIRGTNADMKSTKPMSGKFNEKELMHGLNDRLAGFIEKVHQLERHNHLLEREIEEIRGKSKPASCLEEEYGPELGNLRQLVQDLTHQKHQIEIEHQNLEEELSSLRKQHEQEARSRSDADGVITVLKKDISDAYQAKLQLDKKAQSLVDEIHFLKRNHEVEVSEMFDQIQDAQMTVRAHEFGHPGVTAALRDIRTQLEGHTVCDVRQMGETFRSQFARLTEAAESKREAIKASQQEIQEYRRRLQAKTVELDCARGTREALEKQLHDVEDRHKEEMIHYQNTIKELENELINCKFDMSGYLREYQDLLNVKMALDVEIMSYRKLLCGEEARLSSMSDTHISLPYIYHQSPIYTLPCHSRPGGPHRRVEPHYKFVEEIITETTREIEMSEFEETGSEETEAEKEECAKRERGGSEEEDSDNKDGGEEEGNQMSDSQQDQSGEESVSDNRGEEIPVEVDDAEKDQHREESEETGEADNEGEGGMDKNTTSKVLLSESINEEEHLKADESTEKKKEAAVVMETVQTDPSPKPADLKPEVIVNGEPLKESEDSKEGDAEGDSLDSAQAKKPVDESSAGVSGESDKTKEPSSVFEVQDEVKTLVKTGFTAEAMGTLSKETGEVLENGQVTSTPKNVEKDNSHTEPEEISNPCDDKVAKSLLDAKNESNKDQHKEPSVKSIAKSLPEVEGMKSNSGGKIQTTVLPKEKITGTAEIKELHQGAAESSQVQKAKLPAENK